MYKDRAYALGLEKPLPPPMQALFTPTGCTPSLTFIVIIVDSVLSGTIYDALDVIGHSLETPPLPFENAAISIDLEFQDDFLPYSSYFPTHFGSFEVAALCGCLS